MADRIGKPITQRQLRVGEMIKQSLSMIFIRNEAKVPNLETKMITVTEVRMSQDLKIAKAYVLPLGGKDAEEIILVLKEYSFLIRKILSYNIIYEVLDDIKKKMSGLLTPDVQETITGTAQILEIFKVSGAGKVAGCKIIEGEIVSTSEVRLIRDGTIIHTGKVGTLFREKNQVKQVSNGQECGITVKDYMDFQKNDTIEAFSVTSTERSI